jgi:hypothetical protein
MSSGAQVNGFGESVAAPPAARRTIPFDYAFRYDLQGAPGLVQNRTLDISIEAAFTAVSIGYGVVPTAQPITFGIPPAPLPAPGPVMLSATASQSLFQATLGDVLLTLSKALDEDVTASGGEIGPRTAAALKDGLRFNPEFAERIFLTRGAGLDQGILSQASAVGAPPSAWRFYALFDQGSGREFQSEPILNIADWVRRWQAAVSLFCPANRVRAALDDPAADN